MIQGSSVLKKQYCPYKYEYFRAQANQGKWPHKKECSGKNKPNKVTDEKIQGGRGGQLQLFDVSVHSKTVPRLTFDQVIFSQTLRGPLGCTHSLICIERAKTSASIMGTHHKRTCISCNKMQRQHTQKEENPENKAFRKTTTEIWGHKGEDSEPTGCCGRQQQVKMLALSCDPFLGHRAFQLFTGFQSL